GQTIFENNPGVVFHGPSVPPCAPGTLAEPADTIAPSLPVLLATQNGRTVNLSWTASTDDVGVRYYKIYRDGTPTAPLLIKMVGAATTSYADLNVPTGDHSYVVEALDAAGNSSGFSSTGSVTIGAVIPRIDSAPA